MLIRSYISFNKILHSVALYLLGLQICHKLIIFATELRCNFDMPLFGILGRFAALMSALCGLISKQIDLRFSYFGTIFVKYQRLYFNIILTSEIWFYQDFSLRACGSLYVVWPSRR